MAETTNMTDRERELQEKYEKSEQNLLKLKKLAHKAVADHENLQRKYDQNQKQYDELTQRLKDTEDQLSKLQSVLEPVYDEYNDIEAKLSIEQNCRSKAEQYASKVVKQNKKLKRQSQYLLQQLNNTQVNIVDIPLDDETDSASEPEDQKDHLNQIIQGLQDEVVSLRHKATKLEEQYQEVAEKEQMWRTKYENEAELHKRTQSSLQQHEASLHQFHRLSTRAFTEFQDLKDRYEEEKTLKLHAMRNAAESLKERNIMKRESAVLLHSVAHDERLTKALQEIETLTGTLEAERIEHNQKVEELEETIKDSKDEKRLEEYDEKLQASFEEIDRLQKQSRDQQTWTDKLQKEVEELTAKLKDAEDRLKPPPPPPPPPPPVGFLKPLKQLIKGNKKAGGPSQQAKDEKADKYKDAIDEMMSRIKAGKTGLQSAQGVRRPSQPSDKPIERGAMDEMHAILITLKKRRPAADMVEEPTGDSNNNSSQDDLGEKSELEKMYLRVRGGDVKKNLSPITEESSSEVSYL